MPISDEGRRQARSGFSQLAAEMRREFELSGRGSEDDYAHQGDREMLRRRAEVELNDLSDIEEMYFLAPTGSPRRAAIREKVLENLCDLDRYPPELFDAMCRLSHERDRRLFEELRAATDYTRYPEYIRLRMADPLLRAEFLSHLEFGVPFWQLEAKLERESRLALQMKEIQTQEAMGGEAARAMRGQPRYGDD